MKFLSISIIITVLFFVWIFHSIYTLYYIYTIPSCPDEKVNCLKPNWKTNDFFQLFICTSLNIFPLASPLTVIYKIDNFLLSKASQLNLNVTLPKQVLNNGTLYLHAFLTKSKSRDLHKEIITNKLTSHTSGQLTKYIKKVTTFKLLNKKFDLEKTSITQKPITHWKPRITIDVVSFPQTISAKSLSPEIFSLLKINKYMYYLPVIYFSSGRFRIRDLIPVEKNKKIMPLQINLEPTTLGKLRFGLFVEASLNTMNELGFSNYDTDDIKGIFYDTNLYLLLLTVLVSSFHLLFDFLAFKNDIQFWRRQKSMEGLSFNTFVWRCISQIIIALYLHDQHTSLLVLIPADIGAFIEIWKLKKAMKIEIKGFKVLMKPRSSAEKLTDEYDSYFVRYLSIYVLYPLIIIGAIYSLFYIEHQSWYSWVIQSAANGVYALGFLFILPQLFINYKLKSVTHLPWKTFMYKALNTFIDDLFAFILTSLPISYRVAAFRDDVVFLIYLYQRWLYPVDQTRQSEFSNLSFESDKKTD